MANITANPWSFTNSDVKSSAISGLSQHTENSQLLDLTTSAAHNIAANGFATIIGTTPASFVGLYKALVVPTSTTATLKRIAGTPLASGLTWTSGGNVLIPSYVGPVRGEDMSWQDANAANDQITVYSAYGTLVWDTIAPTKGNYSRGKPFWIIGIAPATISSGTLFLTVN
jgi:hypothetical protein